MIYNVDVMWITCGRQHEETPKEFQDSESHGSFPYLGGPLGGRGRARGSRLEQRSGPAQGSSEAMPRYENGRLCGLRRSQPHLPNVNHRSPGVRTIGKDPNRLHQGEEGPVGTFMTITAARRGGRREPPPNVRCAT